MNKYNYTKAFSTLGLDFKMSNNGRQLMFTCPFHDDSHPSLSFSLEKGIFKCWGCNKSGTFLSLFYYFKNKKKKEVDLSQFREESTIPIKTDQSVDDVTEITLPKEFILFEEAINSVIAKEPLEYLYARKITNYQIFKYKMGFCTRGYYSGRVLIPIRSENDRLVSYIARDFLGNAKKKVLTPAEGSKIKNYFFNFKEALKLDHFVLTEGVFSCLSVGNRGIASFGKSLTDTQIAKLINNPCSRLTVCLDGDAIDEAEKIARVLTPYLPDVRIATLPPNDDPNSIDPKLLNDLILKAKKYEYETTIDFV